MEQPCVANISAKSKMADEDVWAAARRRGKEKALDWRSGDIWRQNNQ